MKKISCVVIGSGSIGERHTFNLMQFFNKNVAVLSRDKNKRFRNPALNKSEKVCKISRVDLSKITDLELVVIATPSSIRSEILEDFKYINTKYIYTEVPAAISYREWSKLKERALDLEAELIAGYNMRFHPGIERINRLNKNKFLSLRAIFGEFLPDLHKWEDYKVRYEAIKQLGGGPLLTSHHELDIAIKLMGKVLEVSSFSRNTALDIDSHDHVIIKLFHESGSISNIDLNFYYKNYTRRIEIATFENLIIYEPFLSGLKISNEEEYSYQDFDFNKTYLDCISNLFTKTNPNQISNHEVDHLMKVTDACLLSSNENGKIMKV